MSLPRLSSPCHLPSPPLSLHCLPTAPYGHKPTTLSLPPQAAPPLRPQRRREVSHSPHSSQALLVKSVAEVPENPLELGMVAGRGTKADAEARGSSPSDRRPWQSCVVTSVPGAFLSISPIGQLPPPRVCDYAAPCPAQVWQQYRRGWSPASASRRRLTKNGYRRPSMSYRIFSILNFWGSG